MIPVKPTSTEPAPLSPFEVEVIDMFVRIAALLGMSRSVGEIYGLLYTAPEPLPMDTIVARLRISLGSASQGLRLLRSFGAVKPQYVAGERRDHFVAETELRALLGGYFQEQVYPHLKNGASRLESLQQTIAELPANQKKFARQRVERLERWHRTALELLPMAREISKA